jgi:hypothetical protein
MNRVIYAVEDCDGGGIEMGHLFLLPEGLEAREADLILERVMDTVTQNEYWNWDDALAVLEPMGWQHLSFETCANAY